MAPIMFVILANLRGEGFNAAAAAAYAESNESTDAADVPDESPVRLADPLGKGGGKIWGLWMMVSKTCSQISHMNRSSNVFPEPG